MGIKSFKETISKMTFRQKAAYLWTYYKWVPIAAAGVVLLICMVISSVKNSAMTTLYSGAVINHELSAEGEYFLSDGLFGYLNGETGKDRVDMFTTYYNGLSASFDPQADSAAAIKINAMVASKELDYVIMDRTAYDYYKEGGIFMPLDQLFTPQQLEQMGVRTVAPDPESSITYPVALDISGTAFAEECLQNGQTVYIAFPGNTEHPVDDVTFLQYLLGLR